MGIEAFVRLFFHFGNNFIFEKKRQNERSNKQQQKSYSTEF
jgi:hypothetical protein